MHRPDARLLTGVAGLAVAALLLIEFGVRTSLGPRPALEDGSALVAFAERTATPTLVITLVDTLMMACLILFLAAFRELVTLAEGGLEWVTAIIMGAGLVFVGVTIVGDSMEAGGALGSDASTVRTLTAGYLFLFGPVSYVLVALVAAASGYVILASMALPRWTGIASFVVAAMNVAAVPTVFGGTDDTKFYSVGGWGGAVFATFPWIAWVIMVGVLALRERRISGTGVASRVAARL
ncbi:MAG: hypothetical protein V4479_01715 [Actinomycetota bacterium]